MTPRPPGRAAEAGLEVRPRDLSFARAVRAVLSAIRLGHARYQAVTSEIAGYRNVVGRDRHRARKSKSPSSFAHAGPCGHRHPHRPRRHHHGQLTRPELNSENTAHPPETRTIAGPWTRPPPARRYTGPPADTAGRKLPAVTKNRNYPQPVKHLNPTALGLHPATCAQIAQI